MDANALRWDGRSPGHVEVFSLDVMDPDNQAAWWFLYTLDAPLDGEEHSTLWGAHFSARNEPERFALRTEFPARAFATQSDGFHIRVSKAELSRDRAKGGLRNPRAPEHVLRWNLALDEHADPLQVYPSSRIYDKTDPPLKLLAPTPLSRANGVVEAGEERFTVRDGRAHQAHAWGRGRFQRWNKGFATLFREEPGAYVHAFQGIAEGKQGTGAVHYVDPDGEQLTFPKVKTVYREGSKREPGVWTFEAKRRGWRLSGRFSSSLQRMVGVRFEDPDGSQRYCHHAGMADATFELWRSRFGRKSLEKTLTSKRASSFEQGGGRAFDNVEFFL